MLLPFLAGLSFSAAAAAPLGLPPVPVPEDNPIKTATLRNVALTQPYMHDGSLETLEDVVDFYNNGGRVKEDDPISGFQSGGIRPLNLTDQEKQDLVEFMHALTSPSIEQMAKQ